MISGTSRASRTVSRIVFAAVGAACMALSSANACFSTAAAARPVSAA